MDAERFELLRLLHVACAVHRRTQMCLTGEGPFTRVWFVYRMGDIDLIRDTVPEERGTYIHCLTTRT